MFEQALNIITGYLAQLAFFNNIYAIVQRVNDGDKTVPAFDKGDGQYIPIEYDTTNGMCYFRKNGKPIFTNVTDESKRYTSCSNIVYDISYPVKLVCWIPKSKAVCDSGFADDYFADIIISTVTGVSLATAFNARSAKFTASGYESDNLRILQDEYSNWKEIVDINYKWSYLSIDFNLEITIDKQCLDSCNYNVQSLTPAQQTTLCDLVADCSVIETILNAIDMVVGETPTGTIDGANKTFTTSLPYEAGKLFVYKNGQRLILGQDYTETNPATGAYDYIVAPLAGDLLRNDYRKA